MHFIVVQLLAELHIDLHITYRVKMLMIINYNTGWSGKQEFHKPKQCHLIWEKFVESTYCQDPV